MTEGKSEVVVMQSDSEEEESASDPFPDTDEFRTVVGQFDVVYVAVGVIIGIGYLSGFSELVTAQVLKNKLENPEFGYIVFPLLAGHVGQIAIQAQIEVTDCEMAPEKKGHWLAVPAVVLTMATGFEYLRPASFILSAAILAWGAIYWGYYGRNGMIQFIMVPAGFGLAIMAGLGITAVYL